MPTRVSVAAASEPTRKQRVAAANLSQLTYFMDLDAFGDSDSDVVLATAILPKGSPDDIEGPDGDMLRLIRESLHELGFKSDNISRNRAKEVGSSSGDRAHLWFTSDDRARLTFNREGIQRLIDRGVRSPTLDAFAGRKPQALQAATSKGG